MSADTQNRRVALVIDGLGAGGAEKTVSDIGSALIASGVDTTIIYLQERPGRAALEACAQRNIPTLHVQVTRLWKIQQWLNLALCIRSLKPNAIHAHLQYATITSLIIGALLRIQTVVTLHTLDEPDMSSKAGLRLRLMFALIRYLPCELICLTNQARGIALKYAPKKLKNVHVVPNGLDLSEWDEKQRSVRLEGGDKPIIMLTVAVLRRMKGIHHLIRAHGALSKELPNLHLWIVGDGPERESLEHEARLIGSRNRVFFAGHRTDIREIMQSADLFVLPTLFDALPTVIIEAMAAGLPIVASHTGGIPEMIEDGETGLLVEPGNEDDLIAACRRIVQESKLAERLVESARDSVKHRFDLNIQVERLMSLYGLKGAA